MYLTTGLYRACTPISLVIENKYVQSAPVIVILFPTRIPYMAYVYGNC